MAGTPSHNTPTTTVTDVVAFLFSLAALRDWLKLILIGGTLEALRRLAMYTYESLVSFFWVTAYFDQDDSSYNWMMVWLSKQPNWAKAREVEVSTRAFDGRDTATVLVAGEQDDAATAISGSRKLAYLPSVTAKYHMWYNRRLVMISRVQTEGGFYGQKKETLHVSILARSHRVLNQMLLDAKKQYLSDQANTISIYVSDSHNDWRHVASRPKRPLRSIVLDPGIKDLLMNDAREFLESRKWYTERGIPFRRGYLLYGAPGSGKTSIIHSLAGELGLDIYIISLSRGSLDDTALSELISDLPQKCIALMEDIDAAFHQSLNRDDDAPDPTLTPGIPPARFSAPPRSASRISLSGLLNALDGIGAQEGRLLYATTNKFSALDSALCRPGRMDVHVEFKLASKFQASELFRAFYLPPSDNLDEKGVPSTSPDLIDLGNIPNALTSRMPHLSRDQLAHLAQRFGDMLPEREFSMASLQGYLMTYKTRPLEAVEGFDVWIQKERADRLEKAKKLSLSPTDIASPGPASPSADAGSSDSDAESS